jgi:hypothetical protein
VTPLSLPTLGELVDPPAPPVREEPKPELRPRRPLPPRQPVIAITPVPEPAPKPKKRAVKPRRTRAGRRPLRIALVGAVLIASVHLAFNAVNSSASEEVVIRPKRRLVTAPPTLASQDGRPETTAATVLPGLPIPRPVSPTLPRESAYAVSPGEAGSEIQPAPSAIMLVAPGAVNTDSLTPKLVDTTGKKTMKGVLRAIGGTSTPERSRPKR